MRQGFNVTQYEAACRKRTKASSLIIFILIPATIAAGCIFLDNERYMVIALALLIYTMVPFFMVFEKRKPKAREIVLIAMMAAITVCAQLFFHMVLPLQIGTALIIISGIALGPEAGFLIGATARFICNFYMGQGPWTPWQMFAMGLIGFLGGVCFHNGPLRQSRLSLAIFGAVCSVLVYGGIMNPSTALIWARTLDWKVLLSYYLTGIPWDLVRGAATALFLWFGAEPMLEKLERIQIKYGLMEHRENAER